MSRITDALRVFLRGLLPGPIRTLLGRYNQWRFKRRAAEVEEDLEAIRELKDDLKERE